MEICFRFLLFAWMWSWYQELEEVEAKKVRWEQLGSEAFRATLYWHLLFLYTTLVSYLLLKFIQFQSTSRNGLRKLLSKPLWTRWPQIPPLANLRGQLFRRRGNCKLSPKFNLGPKPFNETRQVEIVKGGRSSWLHWSLSSLSPWLRRELIPLYTTLREALIKKKR